jgi:hypothetical protein
MYCVCDYQASFGGWKRAITKPERSVESVILDSDIAEELLQGSRSLFSLLLVPQSTLIEHGIGAC